MWVLAAGSLQAQLLPPDLVRGHIRVKLKENAKTPVVRMTRGALQTGLTSVDTLNLRLGAYRMERVFRYAPKFEERVRQEGLHLWYDVYFDENKPVTRAVSGYKDLPDIEYVEPVYREVFSADNRAVVPFTDPELVKQWHYNNNGSQYQMSRGADINLFNAWKIEQGRPEVVVAVVDGGVDCKHVDLVDNIWVNEAELYGVPGVDDDGNGFVDDVNGWNFVTDKPVITATEHGTHVAGTVAARNGNGIGVCGVAGGDASHGGVKVMSCQIMMDMPDGSVQGTSRNPESFYYAANSGAVISQNSWSYGKDNQGNPMTSTPQVMKEAIAYFIKYAGCDPKTGGQKGLMKGGIVFFAASNSGMENKVYPSSEENVIAVASIDSEYKKAATSNYGSWVDIAAPGGTSYIPERQIYSTLPDNKYGGMSGTSMACPHVSGVAALIVSKFGGPGLTAEMVKERLLKSGRNIDAYNPSYAGKLGVGLMDAAKALSVDQVIPPKAVTSLKAVSTGIDYIQVEWTVPEDEDDGFVESYCLYYGTDSLTAENLPAAAVAGNIRYKQAGDKMTPARFNNLKKDTRYFFAVVCQDHWGHQSEVWNLAVRTVKNYPPVITPRESESVVLYENEQLELLYDVSDPEGQEFSVRLRDQSGLAYIQRYKDVVTLKISTDYQSAGDYEVKLVATDEYRDSSVLTVPFKVLNVNRPPVVVKTPEDLTCLPGEKRELLLTDYFKDEDGDLLLFQLDDYKDAGKADLKISGDKLLIDALAPGQCECRIQASDPDGETAEIVLRLTILSSSPSSSGNLVVYPNPVRDHVSFKIEEGIEGQVTVRLYSAAGELVRTVYPVLSAGEAGQMSLQGLTPGIYLFVLEHQGKMLTKRIIKQ